MGSASAPLGLGEAILSELAYWPVWMAWKARELPVHPTCCARMESELENPHEIGPLLLEWKLDAARFVRTQNET